MAIETPISPATFACVYSTELEHVNVEFCGIFAPDGRVVQDYPTREALDLLERLVAERDAAIRAAELARVVKRLRDLAGNASVSRYTQAVAARIALLDAADLLEREGTGT